MPGNPPRTTTPSTIILHGDDTSRQRRDGVAQGTILPGSLISVGGSVDTGADDAREASLSDVDGEKVAVRVALEYSHTGRSIEDSYSADDHLEYKHLESGDRFYGYVFDGDNADGAGTDIGGNANISLGDRLTSYSGAGESGTFRAVADADSEGAALVEAVEAVDNSSNGNIARIELEVL